MAGRDEEMDEREYEKGLLVQVQCIHAGGCTGCNECPVPRLDRSTPSEWGCNRDPKTPIPKNTSSVSTYSGGKQVPVYVEHDRLRVKIFFLKA
ncbi:hypothetical protein APICC_01347 [Apis cerana cerana]|uniref:Uncharacterized protein n=1 Tax=Apis cerana cerana TaxID=94128 RepID=A0A2A3E3Y1_APICC|nr:hypothetical protein APICC_01347 [Apis cerana cerana]